MQFTKSHSGSTERITASYYVHESPWHDGVSNSVTLGLRGTNLRGLFVSWIRSGTMQAAAPVRGAAVCIGAYTNGAKDSCQDMALGILDTNIICGQDPIINRWVNVTCYGYMDRIAVDPTTISASGNTDYIYSQQDGQVTGYGSSDNRGICIGVGRPGLRASRRLQGLCQITLVTPADNDTIVFDLGGAPVTGPTGGNTTWLLTPGTDRTTLTDATGTVPVPNGDACIVGMTMFRPGGGAQYFPPPETTTGGTGIPGLVEGFVSCMAISKSF